MPTNPPANPIAGALYVDQTTNLTWVWTGTFWIQADGGSQSYNQQRTPTTALIPGYYSEPSPDSWFPFIGSTAPTVPACGQIWVDNSVTPNIAQVWDCNTSTWIQLAGSSGGDTNSIVSAVQPTVRASGDPLALGDFWLNSITGVLSYYDGTVWNLVTGSDTHTIYSSNTPATRIDGTVLVTGDLWTDPDDNSLRYWDGLQWTPVVAISNDHQISATPPSLRPDGSGLLVADLYTNSTSTTLFYWNGSSWNRYNDTHSISDTATPTTRPDGSALEGGDQWFNPTTDVLSVWDNTSISWVSVTIQDSHSIWQATAPAVRADGTALESGDMWVNSTADVFGSHPLKVFNAGAWNSVGEKDTHSYVGNGDPNGTVVARPTGTALLDGDIYIDTASSDSYYYSTATSTWLRFGVSDDTHTIYTGTAPSANNAGEPLNDGDLWSSSSMNAYGYHDLKVYHTSTWHDIGTADTHSFTGTTAPTLTTRVDGRVLLIGDQYLDTATNFLYFWDGTVWVGLTSGDTHSITGVGEPVTANPVTLRLDGSALIEGDMYVDTATNYIYGYLSSAWVQLGSLDTHSFSGNGTPFVAAPTVGTNTVTVRPDNGLPLADGDQYWDKDTNIIYLYDGAEWLGVSGDTHSITGVGEPVTANPVTTRIDGSALLEGDMYVDTATNYVYGYLSSAWVQLGSSDTHSFSGNGTPFVATPSVGTNTVTVRLDNGLPLVDGDQYWDKDTNILYLYDGAEWLVVSGDTHSITGAGEPVTANPVTTRIDGSSLVEGDMYVDTATNYVYGYLGGAWVQLGSSDTHSFSGSGTPFVAAPSVGTNTITVRPDNGLPLATADQYWDEDTNILYMYDGAEWLAISSDTHSFTDTVDPILTARPDGSDLLIGDQYINTTSDVLFYYNGTAWEAFTNTIDTHSFTDTGAPTLTQRPDTTPLLVGDQYLDTSTNLLYYYEGTAWEIISNDTHSYTDTVDPVITTRPDGSALVTGDQYINTTTDVLFYYNGTAWEAFTNTIDTHSFTDTGAPTLTQRPDTTPLLTGDQYVDDATNLLYYYDGTAWVIISGDTHAYTGAADPTLTTRPDGSPLVIGDQYINTTSGVLFYNDGTAWVIVRSADTHSFTDTVDPTITTRPDGTPLLTGDQYVNTTSDVLFYYDGTAWEAFQSGDTHSFVGTVDPALTTRPDGTPLEDGDQYTNSTNNNFYYYNSGWVLLGPVETQIDDLLSNGFPSTRSNGVDSLLNGDIFRDSITGRNFVYDLPSTSYVTYGTYSFAQTTMPSGAILAVNDTWYDIGNYRLYIYVEGSPGTFVFIQIV